MKDILESLARGRDLNGQQAERAFTLLMNGEMSHAQAGAFLMGLRAKGETADEVAAGVAACLEKARLVPGLSGPRIDTCGTGGDGRCSFNCSTAVALMLASMGHKVVKHGNRSVSSSCGSADILEALGVPLDLGPDDIPAALEKHNFAFLFAPNFHPAFKHVVPVRKEMAVRTLFNMMGPLLNPARPTHQLLGVPDESMVDLMAEALAKTGIKRAAVVHGALGYDELSPFGPGIIAWVRDGEITREIIDPAPLGLGGGRPDDVAVTGPTESLDAMRELLDGEGHIIMQHMLLLNLTVAVAMLEDISLEEACMKARGVHMSGQALGFLREFAGA